MINGQFEHLIGAKAVGFSYSDFARTRLRDGRIGRSRYRRRLVQCGSGGLRENRIARNSGGGVQLTQALALLKRFGSVTVLNGYIHQVMQKVEGNITVHSPMSTAFPQPAPGPRRPPGP